RGLRAAGNFFQIPTRNASDDRLRWRSWCGGRVHVRPTTPLLSHDFARAGAPRPPDPPGRLSPPRRAPLRPRAGVGPGRPAPPPQARPSNCSEETPMPKTEGDTLRVDVPVGFLLTEPREITVSVDRADEPPLAIRLRLIPAQSGGGPPDAAP